MARYLSLLFAFLLEGTLSILSVAHAQPIPAGVFPVHSPYVAAILEDALQSKGLERDSAPEGKQIERVEIASYDVITPQDPWPTLAAQLHVRTLDEVIERELLLHVGEGWSAKLAQESERNLRANLFLSLSQVIACRGSAPDRVVLLAVTKDLWSLRPGFDLLWVGSQLQHLGIYMTEQNFVGRRKIPGLDFAVDLATILAGQRYRDPRILGSRFYFSERGDLIWNKVSGALEGGVADAHFGFPLFSLASVWAFHLGLSYQKNIYREFRGGAILPVVGPADEVALLQYRQERVFLQAQLQRSYGREYKLDLTAGWKGWLQQFSYYAPDSVPTESMLTYLGQYYIPRSESAGALFSQIRFYQANYRQLYDMDRFEVPEDFRLGPEIKLETRFASPAFGFAQAFFEPELQADWLAQFGNHYLGIETHARMRYQPGLMDSVFVNQVYQIRAKYISAPLWRLRIVTGLGTVRRFNDLNRELSTLGGNSSLRGFSAGYLYGQQVWTANFEIRSLPFRVWAFSLGGTVFVDAGNAFGTTRFGDLFMSTGFGMRMGMPQFNRSLLRVDLGFPVVNIPASPSYFTLSFGQAF